MNARRRSLALLLMSSLAATGASAGEESIVLEAASGRDLTASRCVICHSLDYIEMNAPVLERAGWQKTVRKMIDRFGAPVTDDEAKEIVDYLALHYSRVGS